MIAFEAFVDILTGHFLKFSSDGIEVDKSCYSHRSFVIHLSASIYAPVLRLRVHNSSYNASPTRQTCVFVLMIPLIILQSRWRNVYNTWSTEYIRSFTKIIEVLVTVSNDRISCVWVQFGCSVEFSDWLLACGIRISAEKDTSRTVIGLMIRCGEK